MSNTEKNGTDWGQLQGSNRFSVPGTTAGCHQTLPLAQPGPAQPGLSQLSLQQWGSRDRADFEVEWRERLLLTENSAKESNAKYVPRALLIFNYY